VKTFVLEKPLNYQFLLDYRWTYQTTGLLGIKTIAADSMGEVTYRLWVDNRDRAIADGFQGYSKPDTIR